MTTRYSDMRGPSLLDHLKSAGYIDSLLFSIYLASGTRGELLLGEYSSEYYRGGMVWLDTVGSTNQWEVRLTHLQIGSIPYEAGETARAVIDSGSNMIMCPPGDHALIADNVGASRVRGMKNLFQVDCSRRSSLPKIGIGLDSSTFVMTPFEYTYKDDEDRCILAFIPYKVGTGKKKYWILGDPFIQAYYSVFDAENHRIGLAKSAGL